MGEFLRVKGGVPVEGEANDINEVETWAPRYVPENWTDDERELLEPFFSNLDGPVFVIKNMPEEVVAAISSRVSRAEASIRRVFWKEYVQPILDPEPVKDGNTVVLFRDSETFNASYQMRHAIKELREGGMEKVANGERARTFFRTWLAQYGDDSIAEMGNLHIGIEGISQIAVKEVEDVRIGLSPIEKSSRYVRFGEKVDEKYRYVVPQEISVLGPPSGMEQPASEMYTEMVDLLYDAYVAQNPELAERLKTLFPKSEDESQTAWRNTLRAKAFDVLRAYLVGATQTTVAVSANARALEGLVNRLYASKLTEFRWLGKQIHQEVRKVTPSLLERPGTARGQQQQIYLENLDDTAQYWADETADSLDRGDDDREGVELLDVEDESEAQIRLVAQLLYKKSVGVSLVKLRNAARDMGEEKRREVIDSFLDLRKIRQNKVPRAFEEITYKFELTGNFGMYRDLQRHRMNSPERQLFTTEFGVDIPQDIIDAGLEDQFVTLMQNADEVRVRLMEAGATAEEVQYVVPFASRVRWTVKMSLRELYWIVELRSGMQGHPDYRKMAQTMFEKVKAVHPSLVDKMMVDMNDYDLARRESEKKIEKKLSALTGEVGLD